MEVLLYLAGILFMVVGLALSIGLHEIGHLVPAKLFGVRVGQYMIGFGPRLWSKRIGATEYGVKAFPVGGYISMAGMYPASDQDRPASGMFRSLIQDARSANDETIGEDDDRVFYRLPVLKRIVIMLGGPLMNLLLAAVIFVGLAVGFGMPVASSTIASINECVVPAGSVRTSCEPGDTPTPANAAGLLPGDRLVSIDGAPISVFADATRIVQSSPGRPLRIVVDRAGEEQTLTLTPVIAEREMVDDNGFPVLDSSGAQVTQEVGYVGMVAQSTRMTQPPLIGLELAGENLQRVVAIVATLPVRLWDVASDLVTGQERDPNGPLSVVGVGRIAGEVAAYDAPVVDRFVTLLGLLGSLNIALFVFNLIPLLPLDGGHVAVALWDGAKRGFARLFGRPPPKPVDATKLVPLTVVVAVLLIAMGVLLLVADVFNPINIWQ